MGAYCFYLLGPPFPLMGKGRDRGAQEPIKPITPTFVLSRRGEGIRALPLAGSCISRLVAQSNSIFRRRTRRARSLQSKYPNLRGFRDLL